MLKQVVKENNFDFNLALSQIQIKQLRFELLNWFDEHGRKNVPWKLNINAEPALSGEQLNPYSIWIAEVMLQQTQYSIVLPYWERWMKALPCFENLLEADISDIFLLWQGLGYYSRARRIYTSAKLLNNFLITSSSFEIDSWPRDIDFWMKLPGIGRTTAASILSSAFDLPEPLLDGNVKRVLGRLIGNPVPEKKSIPQLWNLSRQLLDKRRPRDFNQAFMDLGALVCLPRTPNCTICPWKSSCIAYSLNQQSNFPVKNPSKLLRKEIIGIGVVLNQSGMVLIDQRLEKGLLGGMWEFPGGKQENEELIEETIIREIREELAIEVLVGELLVDFEHTYSNKKLRFIVHICKWISGDPIPLESQKVLWVSPYELNEYPFPAANSKIIDALIKYLKK